MSGNVNFIGTQEEWDALVEKNKLRLLAMKKQTAVEWLMEHITYDNGYGQRWVSFKEATDLNIYFQKALAIEKEQMDKISEDWFVEGCSHMMENKRIYQSFEQYYTSTYGQ